MFNCERELAIAKTRLKNLRGECAELKERCEGHEELEKLLKAIIAALITEDGSGEKKISKKAVTESLNVKMSVRASEKEYIINYGKERT